ncbi:MAG TPA: TlyA family RNA methyltransferase [Acidimicrobiia bacterium]|nr:TlyA family RNA methyltransferase [Acidimicrobiia bacterium]
MRRRLDTEIVRRGLAPSRARAVEAITDGRVLVGGAPASSPARQVAPHEAVAVLEPASEYVSRGGHKLAAALDAFGIDVRDRRAVDVGASTGGFTDCLLQRGAQHVDAIDVGHGQLAWSLRNNERVTVRERTNVRDLDAQSLPVAAEICVADLSFISLRTVALNLIAICKPHAEFVLLIKPQFEAGRSRVGRGGVVRDVAIHRAVLREVIDGLALAGLGVIGLVRSPLRGADGNVEFLAHARLGASTVSDAEIERVVDERDST